MFFGAKSEANLPQERWLDCFKRKLLGDSIAVVFVEG